MTCDSICPVDKTVTCDAHDERSYAPHGTRSGMRWGQHAHQWVANGCHCHQICMTCDVVREVTA
jgi:hypothetical protein